MKYLATVLITLIMLSGFSQATAQQQHTLQVDDGAGHYSLIKGSATGGTYTLPTGGGTIMTSTSLSFADFYALMPADNAATVAIGAAVQFPQNGPADGSASISRLSNSTFNLSTIGTYEVQFQVSVSEAGQLGLRLNGALITYSVVGRATGTNQLTGTCLITTSSINSVLEVINSSSSSA